MKMPRAETIRHEGSIVTRRTLAGRAFSNAAKAFGIAATEKSKDIIGDTDTMQTVRDSMSRSYDLYRTTDSDSERVLSRRQLLSRAVTMTLRYPR